MHVLIVAQQWAPERGIAQRRMQWITESLIVRGHTVSVVTSPPHHPSGHLLSESPEHRPYSVSSGRSGETVWRGSFRPHDHRLRTRMADQAVVALSSLRVARRAVRAERPDIILATAPPLPAITTAHALARALRVPFVVDLRDAWPDLAAHICGGETAFGAPSPRRRAMGWLARPPAAIIGWEIGRSSGVVTTTASLARVAHTRWHRPAHQLSNLRAWNPRDPLGPAPTRKKLHILYTGTIGRAQGLGNVLDALALLRERGAPVHVQIIGAGAQAKLLRERARREMLPVDVLDPIPREEVLNRYEAADSLLVHLDDWPPLDWTIPSKLYEAIGSGRHVTFVGGGESAELVRESGSGDIVRARDPAALADLWESLSRHRERLAVGPAGARWVAAQPGAEQEMDDFTRFLEGLL